MIERFFTKQYGVATAIFGVIAIFALAALVIPGIVRANPKNFTSGSATTADHAATSTLTFMNAGLGTTTLVYDTNQVNGTNQTNNGNTYPTDAATLAFCLNASSTATVLNIGIEHSMDGAAGTWYAQNLTLRSTTTPASNIQLSETFSYPYASTTAGGGAVVATSNLGCKVVRIETPMRYVRAFFSVSGANGGFQARFIPLKEIHE